jgi:hypothetical protein
VPSKIEEIVGFRLLRHVSAVCHCLDPKASPSPLNITHYKSPARTTQARSIHRRDDSEEGIQWRRPCSGIRREPGVSKVIHES